MTIATYVTTSDVKSGPILLDETELIPTLTAESRKAALRLESIFSDISASVQAMIRTECELTIEIEGRVNIVAEGKGTILLFNVGASGTQSEAMKVVFKTKLQPK